MHFVVILIALFLSFSGVFGEILIVPTQYETIQDGIDAAADSGDVLLVLPGEYRENIDFDGKAVVVLGFGDPALTVIDGGGEGPCVSFTSNEGLGSILAMFTLTGGDNELGGAVHVEGVMTMPVIAMNIIVENSAEEGGGGVSATGLCAPVLYRNLFLRNSTDGNGGAIYVAGAAAIMLNNTFVGNESGASGGALYTAISAGTQFINNIVVHNSTNGGRSGAVCAFMSQVAARYNDVWENEGGNYQGVQEGDGAISMDPLFIDEDNDNFYLSEDSPCIDAGDPDYFNDFDGSRADIGCYSGTQRPGMETLVVEPDSIDFGEVELGCDSVMTVTLINPNEGEGEINGRLVSSPGSPFSFENASVNVASGEEAELEITFAPEESVDYSESLMILCSTIIELADSLSIPYPVGVTMLELSGSGAPVSVDHRIEVPVKYDMLNCYPNPFNAYLEIVVMLNAPDNIRLEVFDQSGRSINNVYEGMFSAGSRSFSWFPGAIPAGTYIIQLEHNQGTTEVSVQYLK